MVVNDLDVKLKSQANQTAVTGDRKQTSSLSDWNGLDAKQAQDMRPDRHR